MDKQNFDVMARYELLNRAMSQENVCLDKQIKQGLDKLSYIINESLVNYLAKTKNSDLDKVLLSLRNTLQDFQQFCLFPQLTQKRIIAVGGRFSAGKSTFINTLLGKKQLATEIDPTTSIPTYILKGNKNEIMASNLFGCQVLLSQDEFTSLTHEETEKYGSKVGTLLKKVFITDTDFLWDNLALLDTPGYSKPEYGQANQTDAQIAYEQLNSADAIIWLVSAEDGGMKDDDLQFLKRLATDIPKLVLITKSDRKTPKDIDDIVSLTRKLLSQYNIENVKDVLAVSRKTADYPLDEFIIHLNKFDRNFKTVFENFELFDNNDSINFSQKFSKNFEEISKITRDNQYIDKFFQEYVRLIIRFLLVNKMYNPDALIHDLDSSYQQQIFAVFEQFAENGDSHAQYCLAKMYYQGICTAKDYRQAFEWFEKSALQNHYYAQSALENFDNTKNKKLPNGVYAYKYSSGRVVNMVEPYHELAKPLLSKFNTVPTGSKGNEVWVELDDNLKPLKYVRLYKGEINVNRERHQTESFFNPWYVTEKEPDSSKTVEQLGIMQRAVLIDSLEKQIKEKLEKGEDSIEKPEETIRIPGLFIHQEKIDNYKILQDIIVNDHRRRNDKFDISDDVLHETTMNFNSIEFLKFSIERTDEIETVMKGINEAETHYDIRDGLYSLMKLVGKPIVYELNKLVTDWVNKECHRRWGLDIETMSSYMLDLDEMIEYMHNKGYRGFLDMVVDISKKVLKPYSTIDEEVMKNTEYTKEDGDRIIFGKMINVTCIPMTSEEYYLECDTDGRVLVDTSHSMGVEAFNELSKLRLPNVTEMVIVTSDNEKMFVTNVGKDIYVLSRK